MGHMDMDMGMDMDMDMDMNMDMDMDMDMDMGMACACHADRVRLLRPWPIRCGEQGCARAAAHWQVHRTAARGAHARHHDMGLGKA